MFGTIAVILAIQYLIPGKTSLVRNLLKLNYIEQTLLTLEKLVTMHDQIVNNIFVIKVRSMEGLTFFNAIRKKLEIRYLISSNESQSSNKRHPLLSAASVTST